MISLLDSYQRHGLSKPITISGNWKVYCFVGFSALFLLGCASFMLVTADFLTRLLGLFGLLFFGMAFLILANALWNGRNRGLVEFSRSGLWLSNLQTTLPWKDLGPAWIVRIEVAGRTTEDLVFLARNVDHYIHKPGPMVKLQLALIKASQKIGEGGIIDFALDGLNILVEDELELQTIYAQFDKARLEAGDHPDAMLLNIPSPLRFGTSAEEIVVLINRETMRRC